MEYRQIVSITGLPGLYQLISTKNDGAIVKNLADKSMKFVTSRVHHVTPLESIEIYTTGDNVRLHEVLEKIKEDDSAVDDLNTKKDSKAAKELFKKVLPEFDEDRVYTSDIKKIFKWYAILRDNDLLHFDYLKTPDHAAEATDNEVAEANDKAAKDQDAASKNEKETAKKATPAKKKAPSTTASDKPKTTRKKKVEE